MNMLAFAPLFVVNQLRRRRPPINLPCRAGVASAELPMMAVVRYRERQAMLLTKGTYFALSPEIRPQPPCVPVFRVYADANDNGQASSCEGNSSGTSRSGSSNSALSKLNRKIGKASRTTAMLPNSEAGRNN